VTALEQQLRELAVEWPATPDLAAAIEPRLGGRPRTPKPWLRPLAVAVATLVVAAGAVLTLSPGARSAVLRFFHLQGATVTVVDELPAVRGGAGLGLGELVPLDDARAAVTFPIRLPAGQRPDRVWLDRSIGRGAVSVVWCCPRVTLTEFRGDAIPYVQKLAGPGTRVEYVAVDGSRGVWVAGRAHAVVFRDELGRIVEAPRLARNVLLWERDGITYRLDGDFTRARALALAAEVR
jgi:hypothetical protein